jgi:molybdate transport system regulatory protein
MRIHMTTRADSSLTAALTFQRGSARASLERVALLAAVGELGSISAAAKQIGLSYKGAWDAVQAMNNLFEAPLVNAASLTPRGEAVVTAFGRVRTELEATLAKLESHLGEGASRDLFWSLGMRTSARNALRGVVSQITASAVSAEVELNLGDGVAITAMVTRQSAEDLGLEVGTPAIALIKASFVMLAVGEGLRTSARNQIPGVVTAREDGGVNSEITLDIGGGKTLIATVTRDSAEALGLAVGVRAMALIKAPHVILAVE